MESLAKCYDGWELVAIKQSKGCGTAFSNKCQPHHSTSVFSVTPRKHRGHHYYRVVESASTR